MGIPSTEMPTSPAHDHSIPPSELPAIFGKWVSEYYHHDDLHTSIFPTISRTEILSRFAYHPPFSPRPSEQATVERMSLDTLVAVADLEWTSQAHMPLPIDFDHRIYAKNLRVALMRDVLQSVRFELVWCQMSPPDTAYASWCLADAIKSLRNSRDVRMWTFEGANHFVSHIEHPP